MADRGDPQPLAAINCRASARCGARMEITRRALSFLGFENWEGPQRSGRDRREPSLVASVGAGCAQRLRSTQKRDDHPRRESEFDTRKYETEPGSTRS